MFTNETNIGSQVYFNTKRSETYPCFISIVPSFALWDSVRPSQRSKVSTGGLGAWLSGKEFTYQCRRRELNPWMRKIPWRRK